MPSDLALSIVGVFFIVIGLFLLVGTKHDSITQKLIQWSTLLVVIGKEKDTEFGRKAFRLLGIGTFVVGVGLLCLRLVWSK